MGKYSSNIPDSTLIIGGWSSSCNNCGRQVLPESKTHETVSGYGDHSRGCGIRFTHVTSEYTGDVEDVARSMRPDLEFIQLR